MTLGGKRFAQEPLKPVSRNSMFGSPGKVDMSGVIPGLGQMAFGLPACHGGEAGDNWKTHTSRVVGMYMHMSVAKPEWPQ